MATGTLSGGAGEAARGELTREGRCLRLPSSAVQATAAIVEVCEK
jgi:hypothetical protein